MQKNRKIELLAPAKNIETGIEAIKHGADAVYIGAPQFSARAAAGNSIDDIKSLCDYAHLFNAKVYVALNTILTDKELLEAEKLIWQLYNTAHADALIIQDMGILQLNIPPIPLHASTQTDNRSPEKVKFLENAGFSQIVLARELAIEEINKISSQTKASLEVFIHGALCVCYSGQCYLSQALSGRSANRGACAQYCRLPYTLIDTNGEKVVSDKHLLSMKDLNLSDSLEELLDAGVSSLKIEGRLKDMEYVKNTVTYYRQKLDIIFKNRPEYSRSSSGYSTYTFEPDLQKSFNRDFTNYFVHGRPIDVWSVNSPKSIGEYIGKVINSTTRFFSVNTRKKINNSDGLCFFNHKGELEGIHINKVESDKLYPLKMPQIKSGTAIYRNYDHDFSKILAKESAIRKIGTTIELNEIASGFSLQMTDEDGNYAILNFDCLKEPAQKEQTRNIRDNLSKTGNTIFEVKNISLNLKQNWFIPASTISDWRRKLTDRLLSARKRNYRQETKKLEPTYHPFPEKEITYLGNVMNEKSHQFYLQHEATISQPAFEKESQSNVPLMFSRHCIKHSMGWCPKEQKNRTHYQEPFYIQYKDVKLKLSFDCKKCEMKINI